MLRHDACEMVGYIRHGEEHKTRQRASSSPTLRAYAHTPAQKLQNITRSRCESRGPVANQVTNTGLLVLVAAWPSTKCVFEELLVLNSLLEALIWPFADWVSQSSPGSSLGISTGPNIPDSRVWERSHKRQGPVLHTPFITSIGP